MPKLRRASALWKALDEAGVVSYGYAPIWIWQQEKKGNLIYPRVKYSQRRFTDIQIVAIVKAFSPGGSRVWKLK